MGGVSDLGTSVGRSGSNIGAANAVGWWDTGPLTKVGTAGMRGMTAGCVGCTPGTKPGTLMRGPR